MKKIFTLGLGILMLASCSSDDGGSSVKSSQLTNKKWYYNKYIFNGVTSTDVHENIECGKDYSIFKENGVLEDAYYMTNCELYVDENLWTLDGKKLLITSEDGVLTFTISKLTASTLEVTTKVDFDLDGKIDTMKMVFTSN
ncbi:hypothetical protein [Flavobacterium sp.]|uniref:hypothetical protein n=1 Tax=Flavobacterium sp. TaxID=239 RepID=UPI002634415C|nr:hypothetical protein [Flavobacterium sp.]MDD3003326.1 hypothetical protein [Flavobacterium sp.]